MAFAQLSGLPVIKISAQFDVVNWGYCLQTSQIGPIQSWTKIFLLFLLGKVENNKYPQDGTWHPQNKWLTLLQNMSEFLINLWYGPRWQFRLNWKTYKIFNFTTTNAESFLRNLSQIYIWIRSFIWQNLGAQLTECNRV